MSIDFSSLPVTCTLENRPELDTYSLGLHRHTVLALQPNLGATKYGPLGLHSSLALLLVIALTGYYTS